MKKRYTKPQIFFESFSMTTNIAGTCEVDTDTKSNNDCGLLFVPGLTIFIDSVAACNFYDTTNTQFDGLCYHVPSEDNNLFNS